MAPLHDYNDDRDEKRVGGSTGGTHQTHQTHAGDAEPSYREPRDASPLTPLTHLAQLAAVLSRNLTPDETLAQLAHGALEMLPHAGAIQVYAAPVGDGAKSAGTTGTTGGTGDAAAAPALLQSATRAAPRHAPRREQGERGQREHAERPAPPSAADTLPTAVWRAIVTSSAEKRPYADMARIALPLFGANGQLAGALVILRDTQQRHEGNAESWLTSAPPELTILASYIGMALERRAHAQRLTQLAAEMVEQDRVRDSFLSLAAHELRSPLTAVKGYAQLAQRQARRQPTPETLAHSLVAIEQQTNRMSEMIGELHDATRIRRHAFELIRSLVDLTPIAQQVVTRCQARFPQHTITLNGGASNKAEDDAPLVGQWDALRIEQVLRDLVENAARYSPAGGAISVTLSRQDDDASVTIRDEGIGVEPDDRERIFEYLYRAPNAEERNLSGLGLGLFVSRAIVEQLGGRLWVAASPLTAEGGAEFRLTLPLSKTAPH